MRYPDNQKATQACVFVLLVVLWSATESDSQELRFPPRQDGPFESNRQGREEFHRQAALQQQDANAGHSQASQSAEPLRRPSRDFSPSVPSIPHSINDRTQIQGEHSTIPVVLAQYEANAQAQINHIAQPAQRSSSLGNHPSISTMRASGDLSRSNVTQFTSSTTAARDPSQTYDDSISRDETETQATEDGQSVIEVPANREGIPLAPPSKRSRSGESTSGAGIGQPKFWTTFGSLALVLGVFFVVMWLVRRTKPNSPHSLPSEAVEILGQVPMDGKQHFQMVRFANKVLLLVVGPTSVQTISEISDPVEVDRLVALGNQNRSGSVTDTFRQVLAQLSGEKTVAGFLDRDEPYEQHTFDDSASVDEMEDHGWDYESEMESEPRDARTPSEHRRGRSDGDYLFEA